MTSGNSDLRPDQRTQNEISYEHHFWDKGAVTLQLIHEEITDVVDRAPIFLPGGGAEMDAGPIGKIYVVLDGEITIELADGGVHKLAKLDSCFIAPGEARAIRNEGKVVATMLVVMPYPPGAAPPNAATKAAP